MKCTVTVQQANLKWLQIQSRPVEMSNNIVKGNLTQMLFKDLFCILGLREQRRQQIDMKQEIEREAERRNRPKWGVEPQFIWSCGTLSHMRGIPSWVQVQSWIIAGLFAGLSVSWRPLIYCIALQKQEDCGSMFCDGPCPYTVNKTVQDQVDIE